MSQSNSSDSRPYSSHALSYKLNLGENLLKTILTPYLDIYKEFELQRIKKLLGSNFEDYLKLSKVINPEKEETKSDSSTTLNHNSKASNRHLDLFIYL